MAALSRAYVPLNTNGDDDDIDANEREESVDAISTNLQRATVANITMNTLNYMLVPLSMPATFKAAGWTFGVACLVVSTCWSYWTGKVIGLAYLKHPELKTYPEMASEAVVRFAFGNEEEEDDEEIDWIDSNDNARELDVTGDERERTLRWNEDDGVHRGTKKKRSKKARARDTTPSRQTSNAPPWQTSP